MKRMLLLSTKMPFKCEMDMKFTHQVRLNGNFIPISQLAATLTIAKINKKVVYEAFFERNRRINPGQAGAPPAQKHHFKIIGVVGGIGKTSTKLAIAQSLGKTLRVRYQEGNYNDIVSVPLIFFGHPMPSLVNPFAWIKVFMDNAKQIRGEYPFDVVVVELGTDRPGQIAAFQKYLKLDYAVVTAIVPEHMEYFNDMQAVSSEELSVAGYSEKLIYNPHSAERLT